MGRVGNPTRVGDFDTKKIDKQLGDIVVLENPHILKPHLYCDNLHVLSKLVKDDMQPRS